MNTNLGRLQTFAVDRVEVDSGVDEEFGKLFDHRLDVIVRHANGDRLQLKYEKNMILEHED